jgi:hypothetical protein
MSDLYALSSGNRLDAAHDAHWRGPLASVIHRGSGFGCKVQAIRAQATDPFDFQEGPCSGRWSA